MICADAETYRRLVKAGGKCCPWESGFAGFLADSECKHGRLPTDHSAPCGCWDDLEGLKP